MAADHRKPGIADLIDELADGQSPRIGPEDARAYYVAHRILPASADMGGVFALRENGDVVSASWEDVEAGSAPRRETDVLIHHVTWHLASVRYPELSWLAPKRSESSVDCRSCNGTGKLMIEGKPVPENVICRCGGLGWLPGTLA